MDTFNNNKSIENVMNTSQSSDHSDSNIKDKKQLLIALLRLYQNKIMEEKTLVKEKRDKLTLCVKKIQEEIDSQEVVKENKKKEEALKVTIEDKRAKMYQLQHKCQALRSEIEQLNMDNVQPKLTKIETALQSISNKDVINLAVLDKPRQEFIEVMRAVQIILGEKQQDWQNARKLMSHKGKNQNNLLLKLNAFDIDSVTEQQIKQLEELFEEEELCPEEIAGKSKAAGGCAQWAQGILEYYQASKVLISKKEQLKKLQAKMQEDEDDVQNKEKQHQNIIDIIMQKVEDMGYKILQESWQNKLDNFNTVAKQIYADYMAVKKSIEWLEEDSTYFEGDRKHNDHNDSLEFKYNYFTFDIECLNCPKLASKTESDIETIDFSSDIMTKQEEMAVDCFLRRSDEWFKSQRQ